MNVSLPLFENVFNIDQLPYNNVPNQQISPEPVVPIAFFSNLPNFENDDPKNVGDVVINLNRICLTYEDFIVLFYYRTGYNFGINPSNANNTAVTFFNKFYDTTPNCKSIFSLYDQFIKAWVKKNNKSPSMLSFTTLINLRRELFLAKGLFYLGNYTVGQSLDEVFAFLLETSNIKPIKYGSHTEYNNGVPVVFVVQAKIYSPVLDVTLIVNFNYQVSLPCFVTGNIVEEVLPCKVKDKCPKERTFLYECGDNSSINSDDLPSSLPSHLVQSNNNCEFTINTVDKNNAEDQSIFESVSNFVDHESYANASKSDSWQN